jgi:hypothetical protein
MVRLIGRLSSLSRTVRIHSSSDPLVTIFMPFSILALEFRQWLGGEHKINAYCHNLALAGGKRLAKLWGTRLMDPTGEFTLNMVRASIIIFYGNQEPTHRSHADQVNVELPIRSNTNKNEEILEKLAKKMLLERNAYSPPFRHNGAWWTRCSAQVWNEVCLFVFFFFHYFLLMRMPNIYSLTILIR